MRILSTICGAVLAGAVVGGALAYVEVQSDFDALTDLPGQAAATPASPKGEYAKVEVDEPHHNFGSMQRGTSKSHDFVFSNVGTAPLTLRKGTATCKCTDFVVPEAAIPPGGSANVRVEWSAKTESEPFRQSANVLTSDPLQSTVELTIEGQITAASGVRPIDFDFGKIPVGETASAEVYVMAMLQDDLTVSDAELSDPATRDRFDVKVEPADREALPDKSARRGVRITITAKPGLPVGRFHQWLSLKTNLPEAEKLEIPLHGQVVGDISVRGIGWNEDQGVLAIGNVKSSEGGRGNLSLMVRGADAAGVEFAVQSVDPPELKVTIGKPNKFKETLVHVPLEIEVPAGTRPMVRLDTSQGDAGRITLSTTHPKIKELTIGVRFAVER